MSSLSFHVALADKTAVAIECEGPGYVNDVVGLGPRRVWGERRRGAFGNDHLVRHGTNSFRQRCGCGMNRGGSTASGCGMNRGGLRTPAALWITSPGGLRAYHLSI